MIIMVYSAFNAGSIGESLGAPEYSYWFVRRAFWPILERFGIVIPVTDPKREVDTVRRSAAARGQDCVFLSFEPPHKTTLGLECRTIPVFAWEFDTIPDEVWAAEPRNDWRHVLASTGSAITHSSFSQAAVRRSMGADYPVWSIPAPVYDANVRFAAEARPYQPQTDLVLNSMVIDSTQVDLSIFSLQRAHGEGIDALRALSRYLDEAMAKAREASQDGDGDALMPGTAVRVSGVVYTVVFNPIDGRKNFNDLLGGFLWAFRDVEDATLILKITYFDPVRGLLPVLADLSKHGQYRCRVLLIHGMLPNDQYEALLRVTSYCVNVSTNEGQCLPLMEFMSAGRPALAPRHTALLDYIDDSNSFVVRSGERLATWPHDEREAMRSVRHMVSVADLIRAYRESYDVARTNPERYAAMSRAATESLRAFCSIAVVEQRLAEALGVPPMPPAARGHAGETSADPAFA
jgi:glycosyltransferase involved in cell wall biosynthesis